MPPLAAIKREIDMSDTRIPHFNAHTTKFDPLPEFGGSKAILYQSPDGKRLAGSFRESGTHRFVLPFDEFIYVIAGSVKISIEGKESVTLSAGDTCYLLEGQDVLFEMSDDFHDVTVLMSDTAIEV
jgi:uncharacterized cupin superfamily protein